MSWMLQSTFDSLKSLCLNGSMDKIRKKLKGQECQIFKPNFQIGITEHTDLLLVRIVKIT